MRGSAFLWVLLAGLAGLAATGWLLWSQGDGEALEIEGDEARALAAAPLGPVLAGQARQGAPAAAAQEAQERVRGVVQDAQGKPVAGVRVTARRRGGEQTPGLAWRRDAGAELRRAFEQVVSPAAARPPDALATSDEQGAFEIAVRGRGRYELRAEPALPQVGTSAEVHVGRAERAPTVLRVLAGSALRGRVIDAEGRGVNAALLASWQAEGLGAWSGGPVPTGEGGAFLLAAVPAGKVTLEVLLPGRARFTARSVTAPTSEEIVIRVGAEVPLLTGRVVTRAGDPIPGALVAASVQRALPLTPEQPPPEPVYARFFAQTAADGAFTLRGALGGRLTQLEAAAPGYLDHSAQPPLAPWSGVALGRGAAPVEIVLFRGGTVEGRVTEVGSGKPLADVRIQSVGMALDARAGQSAPAPVVSDAEGRYRLEGVPLGRSSLAVQHDTHHLPSKATAADGMQQTMMVMDGEDYVVPSGPGAAGLTVFIETEGQRVTRDLELAPGVPVTGRVLGPDGDPVAGAQVSRAQGGGMAYGIAEMGAGGATATSDAEGRFRFDGLPPSKSMVLVARKAPWIGVRSEPFVVSPDAPVPEVVLRLEHGATITGSVVDERGVGVAGAHVNVWSEEGDGEVVDVTTRADGAFTLEGVAAGSVYVNAWTDQGRNASTRLQDLKSGESRDGVTLKMVQGVALSGVLLDAEGQPAAYKELTLSSPQGGVSQSYSDAEGAFRFENVARGTQHLFSGGWRGSRVLLGSFEAPAQDLRVDWKEPPYAVIEGTVLDAEGRPVPLCQVRIKSGPPPAPTAGGVPMPAMVPMGWGGGGSAMAVNGWFRQRAEGEPPYTVSVSQPQDTQGRPLNLRGTSVPVADPKAGPVTIRLEPGLEIAGRVVDGGGRGLADVGVTVGNLRATTDAEGAFAVGGLTEGTHKVRVQPPAPWVRPPEMQAVAGTRDLLVRLGAGLAVAGTLRRQDGSPVTTAQVSAGWPAGPGVSAGNQAAGVDARGRFRVEGVPPEALVTLRVQAWDMSGDWTLAPRTLRGVRPGTEDLEIVLGAGAAVSGAVEDAAGRAVRSGMVEVRVGADGQQAIQHVSLQEDGRFEVGGLEPGPVELRYFPQDGGTSGEPVKTQAPATGIKLVVPERQPIRGRIVGLAGAGQRWRVWGYAADDGMRRVSGTIDAEGAFSLDGVSGKGPWMVAARAEDDDRYALAGPYEGGTEGVTVHLRQGRTIEGTVVPPAGGSLPVGARVNAQGTGWSARTNADATGAFRFRGVPPGRYALSARGADGQTGEQVKDVADGATNVRVPLK